MIPVIDLFAGPGGLNEGFSHKINGARRFKSVLSVEKEVPEHRTLSLRAFYRYFLYKGLPVPQEYYDYIQGKNMISREDLWKKYPDADITKISDVIKTISYKITRIGQLVGQRASEK